MNIAVPCPCVYKVELTKATRNYFSQYVLKHPKVTTYNSNTVFRYSQRPADDNVITEPY